MWTDHLKHAALALLTIALAAAGPAGLGENENMAASAGVVQVRSIYGVEETIDRIKQDIAGKGITFFTAIDQSKLAATAGIPLHPSILLVFGNPALGAQFISSNPAAGLDWPVRLLVHQDESGTVWAAYTNFDWIAQRHHITDRGLAFDKAGQVITSITSSIAGR
jgi:uncharacterized protein (DUF302 family)